MVHFYFDMDGVLSVFDETACLDKPFNRPGSHYFLSCEPDCRAVALFDAARRTADAEAHVLTRIYLEIDDPDVLAAAIEEAADDKLEWLHRHVAHDRMSAGFGYMPLRQVASKSDVLAGVPMEERWSHVLVDDDPAILQDWVGAGGSGVQWLQAGRRVGKWADGPVIGPGTSVQDAGAILWHAAKPAPRADKNRHGAPSPVQ